MSWESADIDSLTVPSRHAEPLSQCMSEMLEALADMSGSRSRATNAASDVLQDAMSYSLSLSGKRARGLMVLLVTAGWNRPWRAALDCAHAVEMVHTASLIIDDLPCMDDASLRRGVPTNHVQFGEPVSILAAIALLSEALGLLASTPDLTADQRNLAVNCLASAIGPHGMTGGQVMDLQPVGNELADVELTHALKTGTLFAAAAELGCIAADVKGPRKWMLSDFGMLLGKSFQELDDLLDVASAPVDVGKDTGKDQGKPTIVNVLGFERAECRALHQVARALDCLDASGIHADDLHGYTLELTRSMRRKMNNLSENLPSSA